MLDDGGTGPFNLSPQEDGAILLSEHDENEEEDGAGSHGPPILLRGEPAARAIARFRQGRSDLVVGGRIGDLPIARAAEPGAAALRFDPVGGLFGLTFTSREGPVADPAVRRALSMRSEEHTSELQSLMRISYAVFCLKKKKTKKHNTPTH